MIYRYNGTNHTYILNENAEVTDELKADFKNFIKECYEDGSISAARSESEIVTITAEAFYTDTYIEGAGVEHTGTWGVTTLLEVEPKYTVNRSIRYIYNSCYSSCLSICMDEVCNNLLFAWNKYLLCRRHSYNGNSSR